jgi:hypothetical protein
MNASTALMIVLWAPGIIEVVEKIIHPTTGDGGGWGFAVLGAYFFTPVIILCARLEESLFTSVSVRLFGKNKSDEPRTVPTIAAMFILTFFKQ